MDLIKLADIFEKAAKKKGRSNKSVKKQYKTMTEGKEHPFTTIYKKLKKHKNIENPAGLAAWMKDKGTGTKKWREK